MAPDHPQAQALSQLWGAHRLRGWGGMRGARLGHPLRAERVHWEINHPRKGAQLRLHAPGARRGGPGPRLQPGPPGTQALHLLLGASTCLYSRRSQVPQPSPGGHAGSASVLFIGEPAGPPCCSGCTPGSGELTQLTRQLSADRAGPACTRVHECGLHVHMSLYFLVWVCKDACVHRLPGAPLSLHKSLLSG